MQNNLDLPPKDAALYALLASGEEVDVIYLYQRTTGKETNDRRFAQQVLGSYFTRLNRRLRATGQRVAPGSRKGTYRLMPLV